jgi:hypothetical protein
VLRVWSTRARPVSSRPGCRGPWSATIEQGADPANALGVPGSPPHFRRRQLT